MCVCDLQGSFDQRMKAWQRWQDAQTTLQKKRETEAKLLWANKPDKLQLAKEEIVEVKHSSIFVLRDSLSLHFQENSSRSLFLFSPTSVFLCFDLIPLSVLCYLLTQPRVCGVCYYLLRMLMQLLAIDCKHYEFALMVLQIFKSLK